MAIKLDDVLKLAEQLDPEQQNLLIYRLRVKQMRDAQAHKQTTETSTERLGTTQSPSREELLRDVEKLRQQPVHPDSSLLGKYANPNVPDMTEEAFHAELHTIAAEWEQELDELDDDKP